MRASWSINHAARSAIGRRCSNDEDALTRAIIELAGQYGRYGYRRITALLRGPDGKSARTA